MRGIHRFARRIAAVLALAPALGSAFSAGTLTGAKAAQLHAQAPAQARAQAYVAVPSLPGSNALAGARLIGAMPPRTVLHLIITLKIPHPAALQQFIAGVNDRRSGLFDRFLSPGEFGRRFGPPDATIALVVDDLRASGLRTGAAPSDHLSIPASGTVAALERAFHTVIDRYELPARAGPAAAFVYANTTPAELPPAVADAVGGVIGLDDVARVHNRLVRPKLQRKQVPPAAEAASSTGVEDRSPGPHPCKAATQAASEFGGRTSDQLAGHYGLSPLYTVGDIGRGVNVALVEFEPFLASDIAGFQACFGTHAKIDTIDVDGGAGIGAGSGESALDIEDVVGLAPAARVDVFEAPQSGTDAEVEAMYSAIVNADKDQVISSSWGDCALDTDASLLAAEQPLFDQAAAQGESVFAAAGDDGSTDCYSADFPQPNPGSISADDPGSQQFVVSAGGTTFGVTDPVWNESTLDEGAGGGAVSVDHCMPAYQDKPGINGLINHNSTKDCGGVASAYARQTPDVSADADPATGLIFYMQDQFGWGPIGGTSMTAPLFGGIAALIDASPYCSFYGSGDAGVRAAGLYDVAAGPDHSDALTDVRSGNNDYTPSGYTGGLFPSTPGYDLASGLGYPEVVRHSTPAGGTANWFVPGLAALMCRQYGRRNLTPRISRISTDQVAANGAIEVTIAGSGFLPIKGAERVEVGVSTASAVDCTTTTSCTATFPTTARTGVNAVRIAVVDLAESAAFSYRFVPQGFWLAAADGQVIPVGGAPSLGGALLRGAATVTGIAAAPDGHGYWLVTGEGTVVAKGSARFEGDLPGTGAKVSDIVAIAATADGRGYWLIGRDGGEFAFGDARYHGSLPGDGTHVADIVGMVPTADGGGYWIVGADGGVFAFGNATYEGSLPGNKTRVDDITAMIGSPARAGYILVGADGGTFVFGRGIAYLGSLPARGVHVDDIAGLALTNDAGGYWLAGANASVYDFGDAQDLSVPSSGRHNVPIVAVAAS